MWEDVTHTSDMYTPLTTFRSDVSEMESNRNTIGGEAYEIHLFNIFGAPSSEEVHVFLGNLGSVENVPVVDREETTIPTLAEVEESISEEDSEEYIIPLAERFLNNPQNPEEGAYYYDTIVWTALDAEEVTVDLHFPPFEATDDMVESEIEELAPWRILNVPVG